MALRRRTMVKLWLGAGMVAGLGGLAWLAERRIELGPTDGAGFYRVPWPFPDDAWPPGRAWTGNDLDVYVRLKRDICSDCEGGVVTDEAVDRAVDIDYLDPRLAPVGPGGRVRITDLFGRSRLYRHKMRYGALRWAEGIVVSHNCDLIVAIVDGNMADPAKRKVAHRFLESNTVQVWVNKQLEGRLIGDTPAAPQAR
ncbi:MAG: hypothetical protein FJX11_20705 [Alphaproteobacteria bacterium]|nr:hypothetical protein [Alphaproteobacteria bacterium]